jgi:hypothetical protein
VQRTPKGVFCSLETRFHSESGRFDPLSGRHGYSTGSWRMGLRKSIDVIS